MSILVRFQLLLFLLPLLLASCNMNFTSSATAGCDSLYSHLTSLRFSNKDSLCAVLDKVDGCPDLIENYRAYVAMMDMDYACARSLYDSVISSACNELDRLEAFIGMMRLCHRVSANREFYDYRAGAERCMKRIEKELYCHNASLAEHFRMLQLDYNVISANYFASMGLYEDYSMVAKAVLRDAPLVADTAMGLNAGLVTGSFRESGLSERFSTLYRGKMRADSEGYRWLSGHYELMLSTLLRDRVVLDSLQRLSPGRIERLNRDSVSVEELPRLLAEKAVEDFTIYGDRYMVIKALAVLASCHTYRGDYLAALDVSAEALFQINDYYSEFYSGVDTLPLYELFQADDSVELKRMALPNVVNIPECMLLIRNELSCVYAALGDKEASDVNRNSFLDLLHVTRQNSEIRSRIEYAARSAAEMSRWIIALLAVLVAAVCIAVLLLRRWRKGNRRFTDSLMNMLQLCSELTSFPLSREFTDVEAVDNAIVSLLRSRLGGILYAFHGAEILTAAGPDEDNVYDYSLVDGTNEMLRIKCDKPLNVEERAIMELLVPYLRVARLEARRLVNMGDERLRLEEQNLAYALTLEEHKRENITKRASLSVANGIRPYLDRMANELNMLATGNNTAVSDDERLAYMAELAEKISEYNTILERWIKMRHGELNLCIENFDVQELLEIIGKSSQAFAMKGVTLKVASDGAVVKADKALTLFMINTLADNAAKFTAPGGTVSIEAAAGDGFVEIAVSDTGVGLSDEDIHKILDAKVYDASTIGSSTAKNKGSGFGLMNCKGIIEKYKKTDSIFAVCSMDIKSAPGRGSRFSFRLPKGVLRLLLLVFTLIPSSLFATNHITALADSVYISNVNGDYNRTLDYAALALGKLNEFYRSQGGSGDTLTLCGVGEAAEVGWWREGFATDSLVGEVYYNLLDLRNEIAVALLALQRWDDYRYNNGAYTSLHRLVHEDKALAEHYSNMRRVVNLRQVTIAFSVALLLLLVAVLLLYYFRHNFINRMNLYSVLEVNRRLLSAVDGKRLDAAQMVNIFAKELQLAMSEIMPVSAVRVAFVDVATNRTLLSASSTLSGDERVEFSLEKSLASALVYTAADSTVTAFPLLVSVGDANRCVGAIAVETERRLSFNDRLTLELTARYMASVGYHSTVGMAQEYRSFDELVEESERMKFEENMLHVQNQVMDNCLSMIKHETIYYPSRIRELIGKFMQSGSDAEGRNLRIDAMRELLEYYSSVYGILTTCAGKQAGLNGFAPSRVAFSELAHECVSFVKRRARRAGLSLSLSLGNCDGTLLGDKELIMFLLESLFEELIAVPVDGELRMSLQLGSESAFVEIVDCRRHMQQEQMDAMFVPSSMNLSADDEMLSGMGSLIAKEIVRMHEDYMGVYGGRIEAVDCADGTMIRFTLPF